MPHEAEIAASFLEEKGIRTMIRDDNTNPMGGGYVEIRLQVPEQDADAAIDFLDTMMEEGVDLLEDIEENYEGEATEETESNWKDIPADTQTVLCPRCLSINSHKTLPGPVPPLAERDPARTPRPILPHPTSMPGMRRCFQTINFKWCTRR